MILTKSFFFYNIYNSKIFSMKKNWLCIIKNIIFIYTKKIKKYFKKMANVYDNSFIDADILDGNIIFTRIDGSKYSLKVSELQDVTTLKSVELINDSLKFTKLSGDVTSIDLSTYNGFDSVTLDSTTKDLIFYNDNNEVAKVNFNTLINNSFVSGNPFVSVDIIGDNMVFTMVNGDTRSISIRNIQEQNVISSVDIISDVMKFTQLNGNIKNIDLSNYKDINDVSYDTNTMKMTFYKNGIIFKELDIKSSFIGDIQQFIIDEISSETTQRISNDVLLSTEISSETTQRISNDVLLSTLISSETTQRISNDVLLSNGLSSEVSLRTSSIKSLSTDVSSALSTEYIQRISTDLNLSTLISSETTQRISNDVLLSTEISSETTQRISNDVLLSTLISSETTQRISNDVLLSTEIINTTNIINDNLYKIEEINNILFSEIYIYDVSGNTISGETSLRNNVEYLLEEDVIKNIQITDLFSNKSDITHTHKISAAEYKKTIKRYEIEWDNEWIKIVHPTTINFNYDYKVINLNVFVNFGFGLTNIKPLINYGSTINNITNKTESAFFISDVNGVLNKNNDFDYIYVEYDILTDNNYKYDTKKYILGENVINDHYTSDKGHSKSTNSSFRAAYKQIDNNDFNGELIESVYDPLVMNSLSRGFTPTLCTIREANLVFHPYVDGARSENIGSNPNILSVSSHYGNMFLRHDITPNAYTFLENTIAVVARPNNITQIDRNDLKTKNFTSFGYGAEFLEEGCNYRMNQKYTNWTAPIGVGFVVLGGETNNKLYFTPYGSVALKNFMEIEVGVEIGVGLDEFNVQVATILDFEGENTIVLDRNLSPLQSGSNQLYLTHAHIGTFWNSKKYTDYPNNTDSTDRIYYQSPTTGLVAGKLKKIKMITNVSWNIVREAARKTAYLYDNITTITSVLSGNSNIDKIYVSNTNVFPNADPGYPDRVIGTVMVNNNVFYIKGKNTTSSYIYGDTQLIKHTSNNGSEIKLIWDIYRGFGEIQVEDAIYYINNNYKSDEYKKILADKLEGERSINNLLEYKYLYPNSPISKKMVSDIASDIKFTNINETASLNNLGKIRYFKNGNTSVAQMCMQIGDEQYNWVNISNINTW